MSGLNEQEHLDLARAVHDALRCNCDSGAGDLMIAEEIAPAVERILAARIEQARPGLCSQCGDREAAMVKVGTADGWCVECLDNAAEPLTDVKALLAAAEEMEMVIAEGDSAECAAPVEGEVGRSVVVGRRDSLYEEPHTWLREYASQRRPIEQARPEHVEVHVEWRVESESTEDEFGTDEERARKWLTECDAHAEHGDPYWAGAHLMRREVTVTRTPWVRADALEAKP